MNSFSIYFLPILGDTNKLKYGLVFSDLLTALKNTQVILTTNLLKQRISETGLAKHLPLLQPLLL